MSSYGNINIWSTNLLLSLKPLYENYFHDITIYIVYFPSPHRRLYNISIHVIYCDSSSQGNIFDQCSVLCIFWHDWQCFLHIYIPCQATSTSMVPPLPNIYITWWSHNEDVPYIGLYKGRPRCGRPVLIHLYISDVSPVRRVKRIGYQEDSVLWW